MVDGDSLRVDNEDKARRFRDAFSELPIHHHLNSAYRDAEMYWCVPPRSLMWKVPALFVPNRVHLRVNAGLVVDDVRKKLKAARVLIDEMRPVLDYEELRDLPRTHNQPYGNLPANLVNIDQTPSGMAPLNFAYNPYQVAAWMIRDYERFIDMVMRSRQTPFTKLSRICQKAKTFQSMMGMVTHAMR
jgi:hypothetical protein